MRNENIKDKLAPRAYLRRTLLLLVDGERWWWASLFASKCKTYIKNKRDVYRIPARARLLSPRRRYIQRNDIVRSPLNLYPAVLKNFITFGRKLKDEAQREFPVKLAFPDARFQLFIDKVRIFKGHYSRFEANSIP